MQFSLRPLRVEDAEFSVAWRNSPETRDNALSFPGPVSLETEKEWVRKAMTDDAARIVRAVEDEEKSLHGYVYLSKIDTTNLVAWVGILIGNTTDRRRGAGSAAVEQITVMAKKMGLHKLLAEIVAYNDGSMAFFERAGFAREAVLKEQVYRNGEHHDLHIFSKFLSGHQ